MQFLWVCCKSRVVKIWIKRMTYHDLQHGAVALNVFFSPAFPDISLLLIFLLHTYAKDDVSVSRDSPRLTALIQMFPLYFSLEKNIAEIQSD